MKRRWYAQLDGTKGHTRKGFGSAMLELGSENQQVLALCADLKDSLKLGDFAEKCPERYFEMGVAEQNMMSAAAGMAHGGKVPFVCSYAAFNPGRNYDQLRVSVCYSNHNVKVLAGHAGLTTGKDGATHQMLEDISMVRALPNLTVVVPCDEEETRKATHAAAAHAGPVYIRASREKSLNITNSTSTFTLGKINVLDEGNDVTIAACGLGVQFALAASAKLSEKGIKAAVLNVHTIKPLDEKTLLRQVKKSGCLVTVEEHQVHGGLGSTLAECCSLSYPIPIEMVGVEDTFGESGDGYALLEKYGISADAVVKKAEKVMKRKQQ
jgi:transketolase